MEKVLVPIVACCLIPIIIVEALIQKMRHEKR